MTNRLQASSRVALAALLHDIGKFAERARVAENPLEDEANRDQYCPRSREGRLTHVHAAFTGLVFDQVVPAELRTSGDLAPFAGWGGKGADDSLINAAARHHRPETLLQWVVASADRLASGFERQAFDAYNTTPDEPAGRKLNHYTTRQETLLERIRLTSRPETSAWRYPLKPLAPEALFPVKAQECENDDKTTAQKRYKDLWEGFRRGLQKIPESHRSNLPLWLDHLDSLWLTFTHAIPSATVGAGGSKVHPDVSLYDHSRTTAALAVALWRYHHDLGHDSGQVREQLKAQWDRKRGEEEAGRLPWEEEKFLLIQGDFFGIQSFIFAQGSQTQKRAAKLLRGRSFYVSLLTELAALKVLEALDLPATSQVVNAAGKFLLVAPNTPEVVAKMGAVQAELDAWFLEHTCGQSGIGLAFLPAAAQAFRQVRGQTSPFRDLIDALFKVLEEAKLRRLRLCGANPAAAVFEGFLDRFEHGECRIDGRLPAQVEEGGIWMTQLAADHIHTGRWLAACDRVLITRSGLDHKSLRLPIFGYRVDFTGGQDESGKFGAQARSGNLRPGNLVRAWDFSLPQSATEPLWEGYARRAINAYVPRFGAKNAWDGDRYQGLENPEAFDPHPDEIKTLNHLARDDRQPGENGKKWIGAEALMTLKGDVDNLGLVFQKGLEAPTFAKMAALSRQMNTFFAIYLPWLCAQEYPNTYTVFAGGDDFFLIGPWHSTLKLAQRMKTEFRRYVAENPDIHFSAGLSMTKPGLPIRQLALLAEQALDQAKGHNPGQTNPPPKNAVTCFGQTVTWGDFERLLAREAGLKQVAGDHDLSTGYLYGLLHLTEMAGRVKERPENALWHAHFAYRTRRLAETRFKQIDDRDQREAARRRLQANLAEEIATKGINTHGHAYKIALFTHLYQQRD